MPNKKILDIIPPKKVEIKLEKKEEPKKTLKVKKSSSFPLGIILTIVFLFLILSGGFIHFKYSRAEIEIWPQVESLNFKEKVGIAPTIEKIDFNSHLLPGKIFETEKTVSQDFSSSGKISKKAEGIIRIYNKYSKDQVLIKNTRFISASGKLFYSKNKVSIPSGKYVDVGVVAAQAGKDYNIEPSIFSIPGLVGLPQYHSITGESLAAMTGGGEISVILQEDLDKTKSILTEELLNEAKNFFKGEANEDFILLDEAISHENIEFSGATAGEEEKSFNFQAKGKIQALSFKKSDLESFAQEFITLQMANDKKFYKESLIINWTVESAEDSNKITLSLEFSGKIYSDIDEAFLKEAISGKSLTESQILLKEIPQIVNFKVNFWPFWVNKFPKKAEKIELKLNIDPV